jgi:hypothetical protein
MPVNEVSFPYPGIETWTNQHGITVLRLHYEADPHKGQGEKVFVPEVNKWLSPWALGQFFSMTDPNAFLKEFEIDAEASLGALLFHFDEKITVEKSFPIPEHWTRRMAVDPHPGIAHAFLWVATDPWGDRWYYREMWPSKVCFRWEDGQLLGKAGPCRQDERGPYIRDYVETMKWLESEANPENRTEQDKPFDEKFYERVIDYAARAFGKGSNDDPEQENYQQRFEKYMEEMALDRPHFDDSKKDRQVGIELVNQGLKPIEVLGNDDEYHARSRIHVFGDRCPELIFQLKNNRRQMLSPVQVERSDPTGKPVKVRNHMTDCLRYLEMCNPIFIRREIAIQTWEPRHEGIAF